MIFARLITLTLLAGAVSAISIPKQQRNVIAYKPEVLPLVKARSSVEYDRVRRNQYKRSASSSKTMRAKRSTTSPIYCDPTTQVLDDAYQCYTCNKAGGLTPGTDANKDTTCVCTKGTKYSAGGVDRCSCENGSKPNETQVCVNGGIYQCAPGLTAGPNDAGTDLTCVCPKGQKKSSSDGHDICLTTPPKCNAKTQVIDDAGQCYTCNKAGGLKPGFDANGASTCVCPAGKEKSSKDGKDVCLKPTKPTKGTKVA